MSNEVREALEKAFEEHAPEEEDLSVETTETETTDAAEDSASGDDETETVVDDVSADADESEAAAADDESEAVGEEDETSEEVAAVAADVRAPQSWKPASREVWAAVPDAAREEILRREQHITDKLQETAEDRKAMQRFNQLSEPFKQTIAIEAGGDAIAAATNLMGVATRLRFGTPNEKAQLVSQLITQYGVDIQQLDDALVPSAGQQQQPPAQQQPMYDPRVDQLLQTQQTQQTQVQGERAAEVQAFMADTANEFANDVRDDMSDVFALASRRGDTLTLKQAYDRAVAMRPDLQKITAQRAAKPSQDSLRRKKRASKQIQGGMAAGVAETKNENMSLADSLRAAVSEVNGNG